MKAWGVFGSLWRLRREFPPSGLYETNWQWEKKYYYTALNNSCYSIRLLVLHPRVPGLDIRCTLFEVPLAKAPAYEAISYTWGDSSIREDIWVNSKRLNIPASAHKILSSRSSLWIPRLVWIDAICINQEDMEERNSQVILMKEVYSSAFVVSVCLQTSPAPENTNIPLHETTEAFLALDILGEILMLDLTSFSSDLDVFLLYAGKVRTPRWLAFLEMVRNAWFERIWVVQEVALASSLRIFYGRSQIQWNHLVDVMRTCRQHPSLGSFLEATKDPLTRMTLPMSVFTLEIMSEAMRELRPTTRNRRRRSTNRLRDICLSSINHCDFFLTGAWVNRRVCITKHGYIGMVPPLAVGRDEKGEGDVICLIRGAHVPFVLRPVPTGDQNPKSKAPRKKRFQLVGEAYIHGIMEGEMARWEEENLVEDLFEIV
ncbi:hypothetical protein L207DRAFT_499999 [Hyaloscypha variabilis F]|uniref:Heterokaryon incompatibility domain-containing protein n=1 Tax=Hyaloscypha variabilis (strain UAMH 11265 / GT02V1 / F) TaxID=1149755 RepID=A0A2J6R1G6_HYAVF|nr:hypothetical protein L207DRAFT_499999 [Hyaloscypha variabilis F]